MFRIMCGGFNVAPADDKTTVPESNSIPISEVTRRLREGGDIMGVRMGVRVLDHIIIANARCVSFVDYEYW